MNSRGRPRGTFSRMRDKQEGDQVVAAGEVVVERSARGTNQLRDVLKSGRRIADEDLLADLEQPTCQSRGWDLHSCILTTLF